ncbi:MAG: PAS domain S-box protein [Gammaproteobacteria bacterium]|nr:PAS domain S-box protein [Gammaproteobacteria bacterium]
MPVAGAIPVPDPERSGAAPSCTPAARTPPADYTRWFPLLIGLSVAATTLGWWTALLTEEQTRRAQTTALQLESVTNEISVRMESRLLALQRMARRWAARGEALPQHWAADAALYVEHYPGYAAIALLDERSRARMLVPDDARVLAGAIEARARGCLSEPAASVAAARPVLTPTFEIAAGERVFQVNVPVRAEQGVLGCIAGVLRAGEMLDAMIGPHIAPGYGIEIRERDQVIYRRATPRDAAATEAIRSTRIDLQGPQWRVAVWPSLALIDATRSPLPLAVLAGGLLQALLVGVAVYLAQLSRSRARELEVANEDLRLEFNGRMRAQEMLRKLSLAVEQSPSMVMITDLTGAIEYVNPKFTQVTGHTLDEVRNCNPRILKSGCTAPATYRDMWATILDGREWRSEFQDRKKNGELFTVQTAISAIRDDDGSITHFLAEMEDITKRKRLEQEIEEHNRLMVKNEALAAMGQAASMIAHDLRNPLSSIKMSLQILGKQPAPEWHDDTRELQHIALEQVRYMEEVLTDLLSYSRPDALAPAWIDVHSLVERAVNLVQREIQAHGAQVQMRCDPGLPRVHGDASKLQQALSNLLSNAIQACEDSADHRVPRVAVTARVQSAANKSWVRIEIRDNGNGLAPEIAGSVFEPFFTTRARGTGLGLSIARRIIDQHRGELQLEPQPCGGTCAWLLLSTAPIGSPVGA